MFPFNTRLLLLSALGCFGSITHGAEAARPNILFAVADDWGRHAGAYGTRWIRTPGFDRVASEGLLFNHAYTPNAKCAPSRAIILTGRHSWQLEAAGNHMAYFPAKFKSYPEALAQNGYFIGTTGKGWGPGVATNANGKAREICGQRFNARQSPPPTKGISNNDYAANFTDFLAAAPSGKPWCFWFGALEPHRPYEFGSGTAKGGKQLADVDRVPAYWPDHDTVRQDMLDYAFEVGHVDQHLVRMLDELHKRGLSDNTLVVVTSDHGMPFPRVKGQAYLDANRVPLAICWPKGIRSPGRTIDDFVDFTDLAPTFLDVAGVKWADSGMAPATGRSWQDIFQSRKSGRVITARDHVLIGKERHDVGRPNDAGYPIRGLVKDSFLYLQNFEPSRWPAGNPETGYLNCDGSPTKTLILERRRQNPADQFWALNFGRRPGEELYDLRTDPDCVHNLATDPAQQRRRARMQREMTAKLKAQGDPRMFGNGEVFDRYPIATEANRHFHQRFTAGEEVKAGWVNESDFESQPLD
ncbi:MAG: sulfatase [Verrucomicrobia bacterium]|nr:sulfatase [Verrucomicrobiota bacterium]